MPYWNRQIWIFPLIVLASLLGACANKQVASSASVQVQSAKEADKASFTPDQAIEKAESLVAEALAAKLDFFAPLHLTQAEKSITDAKKYLVSPPKDHKNAALMSAIAAQTFIKKGYENKKSVEANLKAVLAHKAILEELDTPSLLSDDFNDVVDDIIELIKKIEAGAITEALKEQSSVLYTMSELELETLRKTHLSDAQNYIQKADDIDADEYASMSFEAAENTLRTSDNFIRSNYRDRKAITQAGIDAARAAKHAYFVAFEAQKVVAMRADDAERHILEVIALMNRVYNIEHQKNMEPQSLFGASQTLSGLVESLKQQNNTLQKELKASNSRQLIDEPAGDIAPPTEEAEVSIVRVLPGFKAGKAPDIEWRVDEGEQLFDEIETVK